MIRISQIKLPCGHSQGALEEKIRKTLRTGSRSLNFKIVRHSIDARKKPQLLDIFTVDVKTGMKPKEEASLVRRLKNKNVIISPGSAYRFPGPGTEKLQHRPVIIGAGPAGLFCALFLSERGYRPVLLERGRRMEERTEDVLKYWETGVLDPLSNVQFGEGGAGTFSDGKLNTQINDKTGRSDQVLRIFTENGAPESILYESKPHIGTDRLRRVIPNIRKRIEAAGGEVRFNTVCTEFVFSDLSDDNAGGENTGLRRLMGIRIRTSGDDNGPSDFMPADAVVLAIGHSARDTFEMLCRKNVAMKQKNFSIGVRIEHLQKDIDAAQYGENHELDLPAAEYKLAYHNGERACYSFCMCPGGEVMASSSEDGCIVTNGMSNYARNGRNANAGLLVNILPSDISSDDPLAGVYFQRELERKAFELGGGNGYAPVQRYEDFKNDTKSDHIGKIVPTYKPGYALSNLREILPDYVCDSLEEGIEYFNGKIRGFSDPDAVLTAVESRTSSPVTVIRDEHFNASVRGIYPCGEGCGYAGGITSAAVDGIKVAVKIIEND